MVKKRKHIRPTRNVDVGQGHDFEKNCWHPAETVSKDDEKETNGNFNLVWRQRSRGACLSDADEQSRIDANDH